jgi:streptogramin lyase
MHWCQIIILNPCIPTKIEMKKILLALALFSALPVSGQTLNSPESLEFHSGSQQWFISNRAAHTILKRASDGTLSTFASGLGTGPHGMEIIGDRMFVCDGANLREYNIITGALVATTNLGATFLNGITHDNNNNLYITDFSAKTIYRFNITNNAYNLYVTGLAKSPNGIIFDEDDDRLVFVKWGSAAPIMAIDMSDSSVTTLTTTSLGNIDGIAMDCQGNFYVASWSPNRITRFDNDFTGAGTNMGYTGLSSPADIYFAQDTDSLGVPNSGNNTVSFFHIASCQSSVSVEEHTVSSLTVFPVAGGYGINTSGFSGIQQVEIYDLNGKLIRQMSTANTRIDVMLPNGFFVLRISDGKNTATCKLVVMP